MFPEEENISKLSFDVGWQFVQEYYITMNSQPESLYKFYDNKSYFCFGHEGESVKYCHGKQEINGRFTELDFKECKVVVSNIDSQASSDGGIIIQVLGEISNKNEPPSKYAQTFFLAKQPKGYYVLNDIFRYLKEEINNEYDDISQDNMSEEIEKEENNIQAVKEAQNSTQPKHKSEKSEEPKPIKEKINTQNESLPKPHTNIRNNVTPTKPVNQQQNQTTLNKEQNEQHKRALSKTNSVNTTPATTETVKTTTTTTTASTTATANNTQQKQTTNQVNNTKSIKQNTAQAKTQSPIQTQPNNQNKQVPAQTQDQSQQQSQNNTRPPVPLTYSTIASSNKSWSKVAQSDSKSAVVVKQVPVTQQQQSSNQKQSDNRNNNEKDLYTVFIKLSNNNFTKEEISNSLKTFGEIKNVEISPQKHFCFVEFSTIEQTKKAIAKGEVIINGIKLLIEERKRTNKSYNNQRMNSNYNGRGGNRQDYHENRNYSGGSRGSNDSNMGPRRGGSNNGKRSYK